MANPADQVMASPADRARKPEKFGRQTDIAKVFVDKLNSMIL